MGSTACEHDEIRPEQLVFCAKSHVGSLWGLWELSGYYSSRAFGDMFASVPAPKATLLRHGILQNCGCTSKPDGTEVQSLITRRDAPVGQPFSRYG